MYRPYTRPDFRPRRREMLEIIQNEILPVTRTERIPFWQSEGRICARDLLAENTLPNTPVSRFDGIAVRYHDFEHGIPDTRHWRAGVEYIFSNTGIAMPEGYDTVIVIEEVSFQGDIITIRRAPAAPGEYVGGVGECMRRGEVLVGEGTIISPAQVGLMAAGGISEAEVYAKPSVAVIPTGNELIPSTDKVPVGKNVESNSAMICAYLRSWGAEPTAMPIVRDNPADIATCIESAANTYDLVIVIAGSSRGTEDYNIDVLKSMGKVVVSELAHGPGRKSSLSLVGSTPVLGIPGPPLGAQICCELYLRPIIDCLKNQNISMFPVLEVVSDDLFSAHEVDFCERVHIYRKSGGYRMRSLFRLKTSRAQMETYANGNYYRNAKSVCRPGERTLVELLRPMENIPDEDQTVFLKEEKL